MYSVEDLNSRRVVIDGSVLEGGGQILRNAVSLSALLSKPVSITKIRNNRRPPGLKNQHRTGIELAAQIASAHLTGAKNGSSNIDFVPGRIQLPNNYHADSVTAGSITLLIQIALPLLLFSPVSVPASTLTLLGGTNATMAPQVDYTQRVFLPFLQRHFGLDTNVDIHIRKRGYYPKGGGEVDLHVTPLSGERKLRSFSLLEPGKVKWIAGISHYAGLPKAVGDGMIQGAMSSLAKAGFLAGKFSQNVDVPPEVAAERREIPISIQNSREPNTLTKGAGSGIVLWAELECGSLIGGSAVGTKASAPETVGEEAATQLMKGIDAGGCVDEWIQDQIIIFMALAEGKSEVRCGTDGLSLHTRFRKSLDLHAIDEANQRFRTAIWLAEELTDAKFEVEHEANGSVIIRCEGIGYTAPHTLTIDESSQK